MDTVDASGLRFEFIQEFYKRRPFEVNVEPPSKDMRQYFETGSHIISEKDINAALIIHHNTCSWKANDGPHMRDILKKLGFQIFRESKNEWKKESWTKEEIITAVMEFQEFCKENKPQSILIYIGTFYGESSTVFVSEGSIDLWADAFLKFDDTNCPTLRGKPKIFIAPRYSRDTPLNGLEDNLRIPQAFMIDMVCCIAQPYVALWDSYGGFARFLAFYLMKCARDMDLLSIFKLMNDTLDADTLDADTENVYGESIPKQHKYFRMILATTLRKKAYFHVKPADKIAKCV